MNIEVSKNKKMVAGLLVVIMLLTVFLPAGSVSAEGPEVITLNKTGISLKVGKTESLVAEAESEGETVVWTSTDDKVAKVSEKGTVKAVGAGQATITATAGEKEASCVVDVSLASPKTLKTKSVAASAIKLKWSKVDGATAYQVYRSTSKKGKYKQIKMLSKNSYRNIGRLTGRPYYYKVRAVSGEHVGEFSSVKMGRSKPVTPKVKLKSGPIKIKVSWKKVKAAHGYKIYRATKKNGKYKTIKYVKGGKKTSYKDKYLIGGKKYYYKVKAYKTVKGKKVYSNASTAVGKKAGKSKLKYNKKHKFYYRKKFTVKAYAYTGGGRTAIGTRARVGEIAVDPRVIPLRSKTYVEGYGYARAEDTGGNIKGKTIDVYKNSESACRQWGVRYKTIYVGVTKAK